MLEIKCQTRSNRWKGTSGHLKDKSRYYETWYKTIRAENVKYQKQYYALHKNLTFLEFLANHQLMIRLSFFDHRLS